MDDWAAFFPTQEELHEIMPKAWYKFNGDGTRHDVLLFVYTHHMNTREFKAEFPSAKLVGIAWLPVWQLHINQLGHPNIRPLPRDFGDDRNGVLGCAFKVSPTDDDKYRQSLNNRGIFFRRNERVLVRHFPIVRNDVTFHESPQFALIYWDPQHTMANSIQRFREYERELKKWNTGIQSLRNLAVANNFLPTGSPLDIPDWYIEMLRLHLHAGWVPIPQKLAAQCVRAEREAVEEVFGIPVLDPEAPLLNMALVQGKPQWYERPVSPPQHRRPQ